jgi:uncharacterized membrane protein
MSCQLTADSIPLKIFFEINVVASIEFLQCYCYPNTYTIHNKDFRKYKIKMIRPIGSTHAVVRTVVLLFSLAGVLLPKTLVSCFAPIATNHHHPHYSMIPSNSHQPNHGIQLYMRTDDEDGTVVSRVEDGALLPPNHSVPWSTTQPTPIVMQFLSKHAPPATLPLWNNHHAILSMVTAAFIFSSSISLLPLPSDAAMSGGRMGGSFSRSYSGGGGGGGRMRMASPSRSYSGGGGGSYYGGGRRSTTIVAPIISPFATPFYNPFYSPIVPYYGGGGVGAISYNRGPGLFDILFLGGIGWLAVSAVSNALSIQSSSSPFGSQWGDENGFMGSSTASTKRNTGTSVLRLNVALDVPNRDDPNSILLVLDRMAKTTAKTDTRKGVQQLTSQVALELLRRKSSIQSAYGKGQYYKDDSTAQRAFNQWSIQERSKFEKENINKFGKLDLSLSQSKNDDNTGSTGSRATMAVVTLVLSLQGTNIEKTNIPQAIQSISDLETILRHVASNVMMEENDLLGAEILWTPEDRQEVLTKRDVVADYPELTAL